MIGEGIDRQVEACDRRAVDEWLADTLEALKTVESEAQTLLDGDGGPEAMAGLEDAVQRLRVQNISRLLGLYQSELATF